MMLLVQGYVFLMIGFLFLIISILMWTRRKKYGFSDFVPASGIGLSTGVMACGVILLLLYRLTAGTG